MHTVFRHSRWALCAALLVGTPLRAQRATSEVAETPPPALARLVPPAPTPAGFVSDARDVVPAEARARIDARIRALQDSGYGDIGVAILPSIDDYQPYEVGVAIYRAWGIGRIDAVGSARRDLGALLLIVPKELAPDTVGRCWITTGLGAEGIITDAIAGRICRDRVIPALQERDYAAAVTAGIEGIAGELREDEGLGAAIDPAGFAQREMQRAERRRRSGVIAVSVFGGLGALGAGTAGFVVWRRRRPRKCPRCGRPMQRLGERADDARLAHGQRVEERVGSIDYDVWTCACGGETVESYKSAFSGYGTCDACGARAVRTKRRTIDEPSYTSGGLAEDTHTCEACGHVSSERVKLPRLERASSGGSGGGGGGGGGSSFGGSGRTGGGGGGGSY